MGGSAGAAGRAARRVGACQRGGAAFGFAAFLPDDWARLLHPTSSGRGVKVPLVPAPQGAARVRGEERGAGLDTVKGIAQGLRGVTPLHPYF